MRTLLCTERRASVMLKEKSTVTMTRVVEISTHSNREQLWLESRICRQIAIEMIVQLELFKTDSLRDTILLVKMYSRMLGRQI